MSPQLYFICSSISVAKHLMHSPKKKYIFVFCYLAYKSQHTPLWYEHVTHARFEIYHITVWFSIGAKLGCQSVYAPHSNYDIPKFVLVPNFNDLGSIKLMLTEMNFDVYVTGVRSCYDEGKRVAETLMFDYHRQHGIGKLKVAWLWYLLMKSFEMNKILACKLSDMVHPSTEIRIARIFNTYGPRMNIDDGRVVSNFIAQALR